MCFLQGGTPDPVEVENGWVGLICAGRPSRSVDSILVYSNFSCRFAFLLKKSRPNPALLRVSAMTDPGPLGRRCFGFGRGGPPSSLTEETVKYFCYTIFRFSKTLICSFRLLKPCMVFLRFCLIPFMMEVRPQTKSVDGKASIGGVGAIGGCRRRSSGSLSPCVNLP